MKTLLYSLPLFLFVGSAMAVEIVEAVTPQQACSRLEPAANEEACHELIADAHFDPLAVVACDRMKGSSDTLNCMKAIRNATFQSEKLVNVCYRLSPAKNITDCFGVVANSPFDEFALGVCDNMQSSSNTLDCVKTIRHGTFESQKAIKVCARLEAPKDITDCLGMIEFEHIDDRAVLECDRIKSSELVYDCMEAITARKYAQSEIDKCKNYQSAEDTIGCFEESGQENPNDFELGGRRAAAAEAAKKNTQTLDLRQFLPNCPPTKQENNNNSDVAERLKHWDDIVHRASNAVK